MISRCRRPSACGLRRSVSGAARSAWFTTVRPSATDSHSPDEAVDVIARILADLAAESPPNTVTVDARCFVRGGRAVLIDIPPSRVVDERPLRAAGIAEIPTWRPRIDPDTGSVQVNDTEWPFAGIASVHPARLDLDSRRRHLWQLADGDVLAWAELLDGLDGDRLVFADEVLDACERVLEG